MEIEFGILPEILAWAIGLFTVYILVYYKFIYSVVDPLFIWVLTTAFASVLAIQVIPDTWDILHFFGCQLFLWIGFALAYKTHKVRTDSAESQLRSDDFFNQSLLVWTTYFLFGLYILSNLIIGYSKGFALLSDSPTESKIANFQQGFGLFRKINWSAGTFVSTAFIYQYINKGKKSDLLCLFVVIFFSSLEGSKSALLQFAISAGILFYHPAFKDKKRVLQKFQRYIPFMGIAVLSIAFVVLIKENDGPEGAFLAFIKRLLYSADSILYYYQPVNVDFFRSYSFGDYIARITNPVLGFFRLSQYIEAPGNIMVDNLRAPGAVADVTVGPNAPFYVEGQIYFNFWAAFPYSALIGYLYARIRLYYFSLRKVSGFYFIFMATFVHLAYSMIVDVNLAITQLFDLVFFVLSSYIIVSFMLSQKLQIRFRSRIVKTR